MLLVTAEQMRALDRATIDRIGVPGIALMENAGRGTAERAWEAARLAEGSRVAVLCGHGNNGGDGFVVARHLANRGCEVRAFLLAQEDRVTGDALTNLNAWRNQGGAVAVAPAAEALDAEARHFIATAAVRVDAILGTGLSSEVRGIAAEGVDLLNRLDGGFTVAVDIPSGLCADTGRPLGAAVRADLTVTYGYAKLGQILLPGAEYVGRLVVVDIGVPPALADEVGANVRTVSRADAIGPLPGRPADAHKGTFGHLLVVAGSPGRSGAAILATHAALRAGCGLVTLVSDERTTGALLTSLPEAMSAPRGGPSELEALAAERSAVACGPGLGTGEDARAIVHWATGRCALPAVLDADALTLLGKSPGWLDDAAAPRVLTPHPGEMARLLGVTTAEVQQDRVGVARDFARSWGVVVLLKGARTVVAAPDGGVHVVTTGGPALSTAGSGDVLTGIVGSLLAQGLAPADAAMAAAWLHGAAGDLAAEELGEASVIAGDVTDWLPRVLSAD